MNIYEVNELVLKLLNEPYENLVRAAKILKKEIEEAIDKIYIKGDKDAKYLFLYYGSSIVADRELSSLENQFLLDTTNYSPTEINNLFIHLLANKDVIKNKAKNIFSCLDLETKAKVIVYCVCFIVVDKTTPIDEIEFIQELLEGE